MKYQLLLILMLFNIPLIAQNCAEPLVKWLEKTKVHRQELSNKVLSVEKEKEYGEIMHQELKLQYSFVEKGEAYDTLQALFKKLLPKTKRKEINYQLFLYVDQGVMNVFSHIGGYVYVSYTALTIWKASDIMAFILAHEIIHVENKHSILKYPKILPAAPNPNYFVCQQVFGLTHTLFKQGEEYEADREGALMMRAAGFNERQSVKFFYRLLIISQEYFTDKEMPFEEMPATANRMCQQEAFLSKELIEEKE